MTSSNLDEISEVLDRMKENCAQFEIDGTKNVWIVKPGAKSRGRGRPVLLKCCSGQFDYCVDLETLF